VDGTEGDVGDAEAEEIASSAKEWANQQQRELEESIDVPQSTGSKKKYVIVGGGWGGWGAAKALCESGVDAEVILIDALPDPTGVSFFLLFGKCIVVG
jgi:NADPH-dependent 2,4-dienoyl-CoA reductase/sulfur reductase-like enzyme